MKIPDDAVEERDISEDKGEEGGPYNQDQSQLSLETEKVVTVNAEKRRLPDTYKEPNNKKNPKKKYLDPVQERMDEAYKILKTVAGTEKPKENQCSLYGKLVAEKLEGFDEFTRVVLMHDIDDILFKAKMKQLRQEGQKMIPPPQTSLVHPMSQSPSFLQMASSTKSYNFQPSQQISSAHFHMVSPAQQSPVVSMSQSRSATSYCSQPQQLSSAHSHTVPPPQQSSVHLVSQSPSFSQMDSSTKFYNFQPSQQISSAHSHMVPPPQQSPVGSMPSSPPATSYCSQPSPQQISSEHSHECNNYDNINLDGSITYLM